MVEIVYVFLSFVLIFIFSGNHQKNNQKIKRKSHNNHPNRIKNRIFIDQSKSFWLFENKNEYFTQFNTNTLTQPMK